jgi:hypothetical protein
MLSCLSLLCSIKTQSDPVTPGSTPVALARFARAHVTAGHARVTLRARWPSGYFLVIVGVVTAGVAGARAPPGARRSRTACKRSGCPRAVVPNAAITPRSPAALC